MVRARRQRMGGFSDLVHDVAGAVNPSAPTFGPLVAVGKAQEAIDAAKAAAAGAARVPGELAQGAQQVASGAVHDAAAAVEGAASRAGEQVAGAFQAAASTIAKGLLFGGLAIAGVVGGVLFVTRRRAAR
jgi:hypothetical protein